MAGALSIDMQTHKLRLGRHGDSKVDHADRRMARVVEVDSPASPQRHSGIHRDADPRS